MSGDSRVPRGQQTARFEEVERRLRRHRERPFERPVDEALADELLALVEGRPWGEVIVDAGCGTGASTAVVAREHPETLVLGIDKSIARLQRGPGSKPGAPSNARWLRANMIDVWLVARDKGWRFGGLLLAYPNPYPKAGDLTRRWHGHAIFPALLATTRHIEVRTNWKIYLEEFAHAVEISTGQSGPLQCLEIGDPLSAFEAKYASSGHDLWRWCCNLGAKGENDTADEAIRTP